MDRKEIEKFKEVKRWLAGKPKQTKKGYISKLKAYLNYRKMNPKELIDEIEEDRKKPRREMGEVEFKLKEFYEWILNQKEKESGGWKVSKTGKKGLSKKSAVGMIGAVRSFYRANGFPLNMKIPRASPKKENRKLSLRGEHVKKLVDHAPTLRDKAIIIDTFQSGMDVSTLCSLDYGDVARGLEENEYPLPIHVVRKNIQYTTFLGRDGIEALKAYLNKRRERHGKIGYDEPLFIKEKNYNGRTRITSNLIQKMLREVAVLSGVVNKEEMERADMNPCRPHALRAGFSSIMKLQGVNNEIVEHWMGHSIPYESAYLIPGEEELKKIYMENEEGLSINRATEEVKKLERKYDGKMETYDELINRQALEIAKLTELKKKVDQLSIYDHVWRDLLEDDQVKNYLSKKLAEKFGKG